MNITVYCGALDGVNPEYVKRARELGEWMAENGHTLVYGAGNAGMMGAVSDGIIDNGGRAIGVTPNFFVKAEVTRDDLTELIVPGNMHERKAAMIELGDAYIALPGGTGTLDEISEVIALKRLGKLGEINKPVMLYNIDGYYDRLFEFFDDVVSNEYCGQADRDIILEVKDIKDIEEALSAAGEIDQNRNSRFD